MQQPKSFVDRIHYDGTREYTQRRGEISYLDGRSLSRPTDMPRFQKIIALVIIVAALIIGFFMVDRFVISKWREAADAEQAIANNLKREASIESIPVVADLINLENAEIKSTLEAAGNKLYDASAGDESNDMVLYRVPEDMSESEAAAMIVKGIGSLEPQDASKILNGSWYMAVDRVGNTSMVVRYADFKNSNPELAIQDALKKQGIATDGITDSGEDESGNTYSMGGLEADGTACSWKVSALPLSEIYSVSGVTENACYVGIRVTVQ